MFLCWCAQYLCLQYNGNGHLLQHRFVSIFGFLPPLKLSTLQTTTKENSWTGTCKCGMKKTTRIVGGSETEVLQAKHDCAKEYLFWPEFLNFKVLCGCRRQVNEYPWIASFDFSGVNGQNPGGCAATLVSFFFFTSYKNFGQCHWLLVEIWLFGVFLCVKVNFLF